MLSIMKKGKKDKERKREKKRKGEAKDGRYYVVRHIIDIS